MCKREKGLLNNLKSWRARGRSITNIQCNFTHDRKIHLDWDLDTQLATGRGRGTSRRERV